MLELFNKEHVLPTQTAHDDQFETKAEQESLSTVSEYFSSLESTSLESNTIEMDEKPRNQSVLTSEQEMSSKTELSMEGEDCRIDEDIMRPVEAFAELARAKSAETPTSEDETLSTKTIDFDECSDSETSSDGSSQASGTGTPENTDKWTM